MLNQPAIHAAAGAKRSAPSATIGVDTALHAALAMIVVMTCHRSPTSDMQAHPFGKTKKTLTGAWLGVGCVMGVGDSVVKPCRTTTSRRTTDMT